MIKMVQKGFIPHHAMVRGFTLIELLIVIAVVGILAGVVLLGIDPIDKFNAANDSRVQTDISQIATAVEAYAAQNGTYPPNLDAVVTSGDLKKIPAQPTNYTAYSLSTQGNGVKVYSDLKSKKYVNANTKFWVWCSDSGRAGATAASTTCPP